MANDIQAQEAEKETQPSPMPSENQQTEQGVISQEAAHTEVASDSQAPSALPDDAKERTKREFDKLQQQLREERARREYAESVYASLQPKQEVAPTAPIYDPDTGLIDPDQLTDLQRQTIEANKRAQKAEEAISSYLQKQEERETFALHPELDPKGDKFDKRLHVETRRIMLDSMLNPDDYGGGQLSFVAAANQAKQIIQDPDQARRQGVEQTLEEISSKEQASLSAESTSGRSRNMVDEDLQRLQRQTRAGNKDAIIERFRRLQD